MVTSRDVARKAGVSQATVSRVLRDADHVRPETRERVLKALNSVGYIPNANARAMRTGRTGAIGIVIERITNPFYPELLESLATVLAAHGRRMTLWLAEGPAERSAITAIHEGTIDGLIFTTARADSEALATAIKVGAPFVLVNRVVNTLTCDQVASDNHGGASNAARYLAENGRETVAVVGGLVGVSTNDDRYQGFSEGAHSAGLTLRKRDVIVGDFTHAHGMYAIQRLMAQKNPPTAVFCVNDLLAFGVMDGARSMGLRVPEDLWVIGFDDIDMASWPANSLTTFKQRLDDMARAAVELLIDRINHPAKTAATLCFPSQLIVRNSTDRVPFRNIGTPLVS